MVTLTMNPSIDVSTSAEHVTPDRKPRRGAAGSRWREFSVGIGMASRALSLRGGAAIRMRPVKPFESAVLAGGAAIALFAGVVTARFALVPLHGDVTERKDSQYLDPNQPPPAPEQPQIEASAPQEETAPVAAHLQAASVDPVADRDDESIRAPPDDDTAMVTRVAVPSETVTPTSNDNGALPKRQTDTVLDGAGSEVAPKVADTGPAPPVQEQPWRPRDS
jgi:hypothetical protein